MITDSNTTAANVQDADKTSGNSQVTDYQKVNCNSAVTPRTSFAGANRVQMPTPRTFNGKKYYGTDDVAKIIGVNRKTVWQWHAEGLFLADERAHDGRYLYEIERVMQLKSVYHSNWTRGGYEESPESYSGGKSMNSEITRGITDEEFYENFHSYKGEVPDGFGVLPESECDAEYRRLIKADIAEAQARLDELPVNQRRGLAPETLHHFKCGYLPEWIHPQVRADFACGRYVDETGKPKKLPPPSERIIIPTLSMEHFNSVAIPRARSRMRREYWKQHAGKKNELFCDETALTHDVIVVVEGEADAMSIWQVSDKNFGIVSILGAGNWQRNVMTKLSLFRGKRLILLFDADATGRAKAKEMERALVEAGYIATVDFLYEHMPADFKKNPNNIKVDANEILATFGENELKLVLYRVFERAKNGFAFAEKKIKERELEEAATFNGAGNDSKTKFAKAIEDSSTPATKATKRDNRSIEDSPEIKEIVDAINETITPTDLERKGYLRKSERGEKTENHGYECVYCPSGTGPNRSGALNFDVKDGIWQHYCFSCGNGGNNIKLLAQFYNLDTSGGDFIELLRRAIDDFNLPFDRDALNPQNKKSHKPKDIPAEETIEDDELAELVKDWRSANDDAPIDAKTIDELKAAADYVRAGKITVEDTDRLKILKWIANLKFYAKPLYRKFYNSLREIPDVSASAIEKQIDEILTRIKRAQKKYQQETERAKAAADTRRRNQENAAKAEGNLSRIKELKSLPPSPQRDTEIIALIRDTVEWKLSPHGDRVAVKANQENVDTIFTHDPNLDGLFGYDEFQQADVFLKTPPWNKDVKTGDEWSDPDDADLRNYLRRNYRDLSNEKLIQDVLTGYSRSRKFHVVKEYFKNLPQWDGVKRAETLFIKFLRVDDTPYSREVTLNWLTAAVARIFHAGCEYQLAPILLGNQGIGKSYILNRIGGAWYGTLFDAVDDPHAIDAIQKLWIVEVKEMASMKKDVDANKRFIDCSHDTRRAAYARRAVKVPRHVVFIITTNNPQCLTDLTGNRRFPVLQCRSKARDYVQGLTDEFIEQLWAEVYAHYQELFRDGFDEKKLELSRASQIQADTFADEHVNDYGLTGEIGAFLNRKLPPTVIWQLMTREERRKFIATGKFAVEERELDARFKTSSKRISPARQDKYTEATTTDESVVRIDVRHPITGILVSVLEFYGTEYRQHVCAAEIFTECFANDRRKSITHIAAILNQISGWHLGARIQKDPAYGDQKKVYYRDDDNCPDNDDDAPNDSMREPDVVVDEHFNSEPLTGTEPLPFDENDLPFD